MSSPPHIAAHLEQEIDGLKRELAARQQADRPLPASVLHAYRVLLERRYAKLDAIGQRAAPY